MPPSDPASLGRTSPDWRPWLALCWALATGLLYARMVLIERAPGLWGHLRALLGLG